MKRVHSFESRCRRQRVDFLGGGEQLSSGKAAHLPHIHELEVSMDFSRSPAVKSDVACGSTVSVRPEAAVDPQSGELTRFGPLSAVALA